jgi:outer membrane protein assembly factor BamB
MKYQNRTLALVLQLTVATVASCAFAQDWPQWRGPNRDAKAAFTPPKTWPKELTQKWKVTVGEGVATPALVGDKLYVFSRQEGNEIIRCLNAADGKELWQDKYESLGATAPAQSFSGPRSSPTVADGKVVTLGVRGMLSCLDAANGKKLWRKDEFQAWPNFHPSSSPLIINGLCIAQLGGRENGALVAYDLTSGEQKWKWSGSSPAYASPVLLTLGATKLIIAQTEAKLIAVDAADGKLVWEEQGARGPGGGGGRGMGGRDYKAATPIVDGQTIITAGRGLKAVKLEKEGGNVVAKELWSNPDKSIQFNTPALRNGLVFGLTQNNELFCLNAKDGQIAWTAPFPGSPAPGGSGNRAALNGSALRGVFGAVPAAEPPPGRPPGGPGPGAPGGARRGMGGGMGGGGGYGSIVDAGPVLFALTPSAQLIVFEPNDKEFKQVASYKVAPNSTHAYPVASRNRIFIKDKDSVTLWTVE